MFTFIDIYLFIFKYKLTYNVYFYFNYTMSKLRRKFLLIHKKTFIIFIFFIYIYYPLGKLMIRAFYKIKWKEKRKNLRKNISE